MHFLQQKSNKALKLSCLKEFLPNDKIPSENKFRKMQQKVKTELLELSHHMNLAFRKVWLGSNSSRITSATPTDLMHAYCHGVLVYIIKILLAPLSNQEKMSLIQLQWICFVTSRAIKEMSTHVICLVMA